MSLGVIASSIHLSVLDGFSSSSVFGAYGLRRLLSSYSGPAIGVRESGGDTDADIGFNAVGDLDEVAYAAHVGANNGFVHTLYDQSGNGRDFTQTTDAAQPKVRLDLQNGHPIIEFLLGSSQYLTRTTSSDALHDSVDHALNIVMLAADSQPAGRRVYCEGHTTGTAQYELANAVADKSEILLIATNDADTTDYAPDVSGTGAFADGSAHTTVISRDSAFDFVIRIDGSQVATSAQVETGTYTINTAQIGGEIDAGVIGNHVTMDLMELVLFSVSTPDLTAIEANQIAYWGI